MDGEANRLLKSDAVVVVRGIAYKKQTHHKKTAGQDPFNLPVPGYRAPGQIAHNWEISSGNERYEYIKKLEGEEPWEDMQPYIVTAKPTAQNPFIVHGSDPEKYLGCTGFPADTHETVWLTLRPHNGVDRCPHCGKLMPPIFAGVMGSDIPFRKRLQIQAGRRPPPLNGLV
ncbi:hypothetical protein BDR26DRAFT_800574 [Obelidium mucronatum]|nr:hypothetical protein BDR26DRAFT_800574 [Obelidium mucronatum]